MASGGAGLPGGAPIVKPVTGKPYAAKLAKPPSIRGPFQNAVNLLSNRPPVTHPVAPVTHPSGGVGLPFSPGPNQSNPANTGPGTQQTGTAPAGAPSGGGGTTPAPAPTPTLDSTYYANVANNLFKTGNQITGLTEKEGYDTTDLQRALATLGQQTPLQERSAQEKANNAGLLSSTALGNTLGQIGQSAADRAATLNSNYGRAVAGIDSQIAGLQGDIPLYEGQQAADSTLRAALAAAANRALGQSTGTTGITGTTGTTTTGTTLPPTTSPPPGLGHITSLLGSALPRGARKPAQIVAHPNLPRVPAGQVTNRIVSRPIFGSSYRKG